MLKEANRLVSIDLSSGRDDFSQETENYLRALHNYYYDYKYNK